MQSIFFFIELKANETSEKIDCSGCALFFFYWRLTLLGDCNLCFVGNTAGDKDDEIHTNRKATQLIENVLRSVWTSMPIRAVVNGPLWILDCGQVGNSHGLWYTGDDLGGKRDGAGVRSHGVNGKNHGLGPAWETTSDSKIIARDAPSRLLSAVQFYPCELASWAGGS